MSDGRGVAAGQALERVHFLLSFFHKDFCFIFDVFVVGVPVCGNKN